MQYSDLKLKFKIMQYEQKIDIIMIEWLDEIFSWLGKRYKNRFLHQKWLNLVFLCRRGWIVISSL